MKIGEVLPLADGWKKVTYFGHELIVPEWVKWVAIGGTDFAYGYSHQPIIDGVFWNIETGLASDGIGEFNLNGLDWRETLRAV